MPIFDAKNLPHHDEDMNRLATILHPTPAAREEARDRGRARLERATMLAERAPALPGTTLAALTLRDAIPIV